MRPLSLTPLLLLYSLPLSLSQFFTPRQPPGCQYPSLSDGAYIYFSNPTDSLHYSIYTPWTRFYPDALRSDLAQEGFILGAQRGANESDACGWHTVDTVKKNGWHRGDVSFRHLPGGGVKITKAEAKPPETMMVHLISHTRRAALVPTNMVEVKDAYRPDNATLSRIHQILVSNSPEADIVFMLLEITAPIAGVVAFLTVSLLVMRYVTNKLYPHTEEDSEQGDIELTAVRPKSMRSSNSIKKSACPKSDPTSLSRLFRYKAAPSQRVPSPAPRDLPVELPREAMVPPVRHSSSVYSRSMDGVTLYPEQTGSWD